MMRSMAQRNPYPYNPRHCKPNRRSECLRGN
jgi:hypothetical protein